MTALVRTHNPAFLTDVELVASFCVRTSEFASIVEALHESTSASNIHQIVIGPRGSGKTSLLLRVAAEVHRDEALSHRLLPVVFPEESYCVATIGEFWLGCLRYVADQVPSREGGPDLRRSVEELHTIQDDGALADRCLGAIQDVADDAAKRLVLIVENLNMMFLDMPDANRAAWQLRHTLQTDARIILLTSATSGFDQIDHPDRALYDLFRPLQLRPLNTDECATLWAAVSGQRREPTTIRSLEILTGGNPRLLAIVARFGGGLSFQDLMAQLLDLVDDHTEYFKSQLESLPVQERRVYLALAELWKPASTREIAWKARLDTSKCSAQLKRLVERGAVVVAGGSARRKLYYLAERLHNIYYLLRSRRGPDRLLEALVRFMAGYYSPKELNDVGTRLIADLSTADAEMEHFIQSALTMLLTSPELGEHRSELFAKIPGELADAVTRNGLADAEKVIRLAGEHQDQGRTEEALSTYDEFVSRYGALDELSFEVSIMLQRKGQLLHRMDRFKEALTAYEATEELLLRQPLAKATSPTDRLAAAVVRAGKAAALFELGRIDEALTESGELLQRFVESDDKFMAALIAHTLRLTGLFLREAGRMEEALAAYNTIVSRFGKTTERDVRQAVGEALVSKANIELLLIRLSAAINTTTEAIGAYHVEVSSESLLAAHAIRALARLLDGCSESEYEEDIQTVLKTLGQLDNTPPMVIQTLMLASIKFGAATVRDWILTSPAADHLTPLTTALEQELGLQTRVAQEVEEVAQDIRQDIGQLRGIFERHRRQHWTPRALAAQTSVPAVPPP